MSLELRTVDPDPMGWALGRALYEQLMEHTSNPPGWDQAHENTQKWHARHAQWCLDHTTRGPGQWPTPLGLSKALHAWFTLDCDPYMDAWEDVPEDMRDRDIRFSAEALDTARTHLETT